MRLVDRIRWWWFRKRHLASSCTDPVLVRPHLYVVKDSDTCGSCDGDCNCA